MEKLSNLAFLPLTRANIAFDPFVQIQLIFFLKVCDCKDIPSKALKGKFFVRVWHHKEKKVEVGVKWGQKIALVRDLF